MEMSMSGAIEIGVDSLRIEGEPSKLYEALAKAQAEFLPVPRSDEGQVGTSRKFKYAGYATLMRCVRPALTKYGVALLQPLHYRDGMAVTTTIVAGHGASISTSFAFNADFSRKDKNGVTTEDCQEFGRCHTYYRRYQLQSILGVEGDDDADNLPLPKPTAQFSEPEKEAKAPKAPKAPVSAEPKSVSVETLPKASVTPSESSTPTNGKAEEPKPATKSTPLHDMKTINKMLHEGMQKLKWGMGDVQAFFAEHVDPAGFTKADNLTIEQKRALHSKMVELKGIDPF